MGLSFIGWWGLLTERQATHCGDDMIAVASRGRNNRHKTVRFMPPPSLRSLARQLGLSAATVSLALRDSPRVIAPTKRRVLQAARRAGYRPNPLVASVMTVLRRSSHGGFQGALMAAITAQPVSRN